MQISLALVILVVAPTSVIGAASGQKTADASNAAVQKVIQMLQDMQATAKKEKHEEEVKFAEFETFCTNEIADLKESIATAEEQISLLTAEIEKLTSDVATLGEEIGKLQSDVASFEGDVN